MTIQHGTHRDQQEREARGHQRFWPGLHPLVLPLAGAMLVAAAPEVPPTPAPVLQQGVQGPDVGAPSVQRAVVTRQHYPLDHLAPWTLLHRTHR